MKKLFLAAALVALPLTANAADLPVKAPVYKAPPVALYNWTGFYVGVNVGGSSSNDGTINETGTPASSWNDVNGYVPLSSKSNLTAGLQAGYNYQINSIILGIEGDLNYLHYSASNPERLASGAISSGGDTIGSKDMKWLGTLRGRLGMTVSERAMLFLTGGLAISDLEYSVVDACNTGSCGGGLTSGSTKINTGWTFGGGGEYAINRNWSAKAEYLYVQFNAKDFTTSDPTGYVSQWNASRTDFHILRAGLNYHFN